MLLDILAADVNFGYRASGWRVLSSFNGQHPSTLVHLRDMWEAARSRDRFIEFGFTDGRRSIVLLADEANVTEAALLARHGIPAAYGRAKSGYGRAPRKARLPSSNRSALPSVRRGQPPRLSVLPGSELPSTTAAAVVMPSVANAEPALPGAAGAAPAIEVVGIPLPLPAESNPPESAGGPDLGGHRRQRREKREALRGRR